MLSLLRRTITAALFTSDRSRTVSCVQPSEFIKTDIIIMHTASWYGKIHINTLTILEHLDACHMCIASNRLGKPYGNQIKNYLLL